MATKMIKDFTDKEFIEEMKRRFVVPQWYTREQIFENIKNYNEELNDKSIDNIIDNVKRNMYQCVDELVESYVENYEEEEEEEAEDDINEECHLWCECLRTELGEDARRICERCEEDWFNQQSFKGTSWNYVLDEAEKHFKCSLNSEMNEKEKLTHDCLYILWSKIKEEEEEEEEVRCVCPKCFAEGYTFVSKERAKELEEMEEMEEMCPFGEKCNGEEEEDYIPTVEGTPGTELPLNVANAVRAWLEKQEK
jgi:hypothetical protein